MPSSQASLSACSNFPNISKISLDCPLLGDQQRRIITFSFDLLTKSATKFSCVTTLPKAGVVSIGGFFRVERSKTLPKPAPVGLLKLILRSALLNPSDMAIPFQYNLE